MNFLAKTLEGISGISKTYIKISYLKTALTIFLLAYTTIKAIKVFAK